MNDDAYTIVSIWLPCGRVNFAREGQTGTGSSGSTVWSAALASPNAPAIALRDLDDEELRAIEKPFVMRLAYMAKGLDYQTFRPVFPQSRKNHADPTDPAAVVLTDLPADAAPGTRPNEVLVASQAGYLILAMARGVNGERADYDSVRERMLDLFWPRPDTPGVPGFTGPFADKFKVPEYARQGWGALTWFQLNLLLEGLYNPSFDPPVFFARGSVVAGMDRRKYRLRDCLAGTVAHVPHTAAREALKHVVDAFTIGASEMPTEAVDALERAIAHDSVRAFCRSTLQDATQPLKWNIEQCRRYLLDDMLGLLHRHERPEQIEFPGENPFKDANEDQLRGYVMLLSAKLPLLQNIGRYLRATGVADPPAADADPKVSETQRPAREFHQHWGTLLEGIVDSLAGLESAISQVQRDRQLLEQERLRSEQEMTAEKQRVESRSVARVSEWILLVIYMLGLIVAVAGYFNNGSGGGGKADLNQAHHWWLNLGPPSMAVILFSAVAAVAGIRVLLARFVRHSYEVDWRVDESSDAERLQMLVANGPASLCTRGLASRLRDQYDVNLTFQGARYEGFVENQTVEKLFFEGRILIRERPYPWTGQRPSAACYVTYSIRHDRPSQMSRAMLQNVKIMCVSRAVLNRAERRKLIEVLFHTLVRECLESRDEDRPVPYLMNET